MRKSKFKRLEDASIALFGEDEHYRMASDAKVDLDTQWIWNPFIEVDHQMMVLEDGTSTEPEWADDVVFWVDNALECIEVKGEHYVWSMFKDFSGEFESNAEMPIGLILREMSRIHNFMAWKPSLERIRAISSAALNAEVRTGWLSGPFARRH